jgi:hypothetical protein
MSDHATAAPAENKGQAQELLAEVAEKIDASGVAVRERVVSAMVEKTIAQRADLLEKALNKLGDLRKELYKLGPDAITFVGPERTKHEAFTKQQLDARVKAEENIEKLETAIENTLKGGKDTWKKLSEVLDKVGKNG